MHYYQHNIGDYRKDTSHLSTLEHGIYRQLLDWYYLDEKPIPKETQVVMRRLRLGSESDKSSLENVLADFFILEDDGYHQARCDIEISQYQKNAEKNKANGKKGGRPKANKHKEENPVGYFGLENENPNETESKGNQEPITNNQEPINKTHTTENLTPGNVCVLLKSFGIASVNPSHPKLMRLLEMGATSQDFESAAITARDKEKGFAYVLGVVEGQKADAKKMNSGTSRQKFDPVAFVNQGREAAHAVIDIN